MAHRHSPAPLEQELEGLPELDRFADPRERDAALRAIQRRLENPYTVGYWLWLTVLIVSAIGAGLAVFRLTRAFGLWTPLPAVLAVVCGIATHGGLYRLLMRWAARPELEKELAARRR